MAAYSISEGWRLYIRCRKKFISELQHADDCVLRAASSNGLQSTSDVFNYAFSAFGLKVDAGKTKVPKLKGSEHQYSINQVWTEKVKHLCGLGNIETNPGSGSRILSLEEACLFKNEDILLIKTKMAVHKANTIAGSSIWVWVLDTATATGQAAGKPSSPRFCRKPIYTWWKHY